MEIAEHIDAIEEHGAALTASARRSDLDAEVPTCPGWQVRTLLGHVGGVHRWAATYVREGRAASADGRRPGLIEPPADGLLEWFVDGYTALVRELRRAPADLDCWSFLPAPSPLAFWARRQAHETAVHLADADSALDKIPQFEPEFAADGLDELLAGFLARRKGTLVSDPQRSILVAPTDSAARWHMSILPDRREVTRDGSRVADCTLTGTASDLYLYLWNRIPVIEPDVDGDTAVLDLWHENAKVTWS